MIIDNKFGVEKSDKSFCPIFYRKRCNILAIFTFNICTFVN